MEIKEYNHYGVKVTKQSGWNRRFVDALEDNNIEYEMMPVEIPGDAEVYIYYYDGVKKYAFVTREGGVDGFYEDVYITTAIPDDIDWWALVYDVNRQEEGYAPLKMHTQFQRRLLAAETKIENKNKDIMDDLENFGKSPEEIIPDYWYEVAYEMREYYSESEIKKYGYLAWDVMNERVDLLLNSHL